jgi:hypothetical protein
MPSDCMRSSCSRYMSARRRQARSRGYSPFLIHMYDTGRRQGHLLHIADIFLILIKPLMAEIVRVEKAIINIL